MMSPRAALALTTMEEQLEELEASESYNEKVKGAIEQVAAAVDRLRDELEAQSLNCEKE